MADSEDPLQLKQLALNYDYLIYKINDYVQNLSDVTYDSVTKKERLIKTQYLQDQLHLDEEMGDIDRLLGECGELEQEFMKLDQLFDFVDDFKARLDRLEHGFEKIT